MLINSLQATDAPKQTEDTTKTAQLEEPTLKPGYTNKIHGNRGQDGSTTGTRRRLQLQNALGLSFRRPRHWKRTPVPRPGSKGAPYRPEDEGSSPESKIAGTEESSHAAGAPLKDHQHQGLDSDTRLELPDEEPRSRNGERVAPAPPWLSRTT